MVSDTRDSDVTVNGWKRRDRIKGRSRWLSGGRRERYLSMDSQLLIGRHRAEHRCTYWESKIFQMHQAFPIRIWARMGRETSYSEGRPVGCNFQAKSTWGTTEFQVSHVLESPLCHTVVEMLALSSHCLSLYSKQPQISIFPFLICTN